MIAGRIQCPLCGHSFEPSENDACRGCPLGLDCPLICCPACGYMTIDPSQSTVMRIIEGLKSRKKDFEHSAEG